MKFYRNGGSGQYQSRRKTYAKRAGAALGLGGTGYGAFRALKSAGFRKQMGKIIRHPIRRLGAISRMGRGLTKIRY